MGNGSAGSRRTWVLRSMIFMMFTMFAMTTDSAGVIIPRIIDEFHLSMTEAGAFHYATMAAIAFAGIFLGFLADRIGHKRTILIGLTLFAASAYIFVSGSSFLFFLSMLVLSGFAIGIFKTGALALIGDISTSTTDHTSTMNTVEGFFGVGAIIGPAIVISLLAKGISWQWLYAIAATLCVILLVTASFARYPSKEKRTEEPIDLARTLRMMKNPYALAFSLAAFLYVAVECAVYVWMPMLLKGYAGGPAFLLAYSMSIFFAFRAAGRFMGAWVMRRYNWGTVLALFSFIILALFAASIWGGRAFAIYLLPLSGLFMSMIYPTINSKGISCFPKEKHGAVAGVILFFTCASAALGPLAMGAVGDLFGDMRYGFMLAFVFSFLLFALLLANRIYNPARELLAKLDASEYGAAASPQEALS
ncbi:MAG: MFS transporter [bacterium]